MVDFYRDRIFNSESNLLFGEGGAGAYSDGKLHTRVNDPRVQIVLQTLFQHGAYPGVLIDGKPHIGSDKFPGICRRIRLTIEMLGGEVHFGARLDGVEVHDGRLAALAINGKKLSCGPVIMAVGHSARDTMRMLAREGVRFDLKPFQLGVRMEHPQSMVDRWQYGSACGHSRLPSAEYHLVAKGAAGLRGDVFSFCMCPGGMIVPTNELPGQISTNGASRSGRKGDLANSGLVLTLDPNDVCPAAANDPMAVLAYLEHIERAAFDLTGGSYRIPVQRASDFVARRMSDGRLETSYPLGGQWSDLRRLLPEDIAGAIARGIEQLDRRLSGFGGRESLVTAPETRPSSPLRMTRHSDTRESVSVSLAGLYPVGEGAGYAGGIVSAAIDGMKSAEVIVRRYAR